MQDLMATLNSFVDIPPAHHFSIQNLPYGVFTSLSNTQPRVGVALGDCIVDLAALHDRGFFTGPLLNKGKIFHQDALNSFMALGRPAWKEARSSLQRILSSSEGALRDNVHLQKEILIHRNNVSLTLPAHIGDYTDFYASKEHATNMGTMIRGKENALPPNWVHIPIGYHGRASSVVVSGTPIRRPNGQSKADDQPLPSFGPSKALDFELEMAIFVGPGNELGEPIPIAEANDHIFGAALMNDWSARDLQRWEYAPLGPFLAKSLGTSLSPWVVTIDALEPFLVQGPKQDPAPLPYLQQNNLTYDVSLEVLLQSKQQQEPQVISRSNSKHMYWSFAQQLTHHASNGCNLRPGDLLGSGTLSGPTRDSCGSIMELTWKGEQPLKLTDGTERKYLLDGDTITFTGACHGDGYTVGFGECTGTILPAKIA